MTIRAVPTTSLAILFIACCRFIPAETLPSAFLMVDVENFVQYQADTSDVSKFATNPNPTPSVDFREFSVATILGDIVAVNGQPAKGLYASRARAIATSPAAKSGGGPIGQAIGDVQHAAIREEVFEILSADGTPIGSIVTLGLSGGAPPPGAPTAQTGANFAIVGGTGAFVGARGTSGAAQGPRDSPARAASMAEDPANRRINGGGRTRRVLTLYPMSVPQILEISHAGDSTMVSAASPAESDEILSLSATGLGPVCPRVDPGEPFPQAPAARVNSTFQVTVNGKIAEVISAVGSPGALDRYQVKFRVPRGTTRGMATIQMTAAWIASPPVTIAVR